MKQQKASFTILFFLLSISTFSQSKFKFKKISFIQKDSISNVEDYKKSMAKEFEEMHRMFTPILGGLAESFGANDLEPDKIVLKKTEDSLINNFTKGSIEKEAVIFYYKIINDSIIERSSDKDTYSDSSVFINTKISKEFYDYPYPPNDIAFKIPFKNITNLKIIEFRKSKKTIKGIECFNIKTTYTTIDTFDKHGGLPGLKIPDIITNYESEMWVTEKIKSIYHPAFKVKEILEKYYPIEIIENNIFKVGVLRIIKIQNLDI